MSGSTTHEMTAKFFVYAVVVNILLIAASFLTTPSMFHFVNFEYQQYVPPLQTQIVGTNSRILELKKQGRGWIAEGNKLGLYLRLRSEASYNSKLDNQSFAQAAEDAASEVSNSAMASSTLSSKKYGVRTKIDDFNTAKEIQAMQESEEKKRAAKEADDKRRTEIRSAFYDVQNELNNEYASLDDINKSIEKYSVESNNAYLVTRALALGALGALMTGLGRGTLTSNSDKAPIVYSIRELTASLLIGSVISVVAFGLFYTKQVTIFKSPDNGQLLPDYWRVTILCLVAGAFADRLFRAASDRVNQYVGEQPRK